MMEEKPKSIGITVKKEENFSEWYTEVVTKSEIADYSPVSGCIIFRPTAMGAWERMRDYFDAKIKKLGHQNAYFPLFIPERLLRKEQEHFEGFVPEVAWVTKGGNKELDEPLAIRPTSETIIYDMYKKWIRSHRDLPLLLNQWANVVRWETKAVKPFLRTKEFLWQEGHTAHATKEEAEKEVMTILDIYEKMVEHLLAIPVIKGIKTDREKFAGAVYTTCIEMLMPDGKALQGGTSHMLGTNFSEPLGIRFLGEDGEKHFVQQTSWGFSTRLLGAMVMMHGDNKGLVLPPQVAPTQVVIVPIFFGDKDTILNKCLEVGERLEAEGVRVHVDDRDNYTPGWKFNDWELKGVPLRIEIGPKDIAAGQVVAVRRDSREKTSVKDEEVGAFVKKTLEGVQAALFDRAKKFMLENIRSVSSYDEFKKVLEAKRGFIRACWCGNPECEGKVKDETGADIRLIRFSEEPCFAPCLVCGTPANKVAYFAKAY